MGGAGKWGVGLVSGEYSSRINTPISKRLLHGLFQIYANFAKYFLV